MKQIRKFVNFDYDLRKELTPYQKAKIKKYYDEVKNLTARPYYEYRPRKSERLNTALKYAQTDLKGFKIALIPVGAETKPKIKFDGDMMSVRSENVERIFIDIDAREFIKDPKGYTAERIKNYPDLKLFSMLSNEYELDGAKSRKIFPEYASEMVGRYAGTIGKWISGFSGYKFHNQNDYAKYKRDKSKAKTELKRKNKNARRRAKTKIEKVAFSMPLKGRK